MITEDYGLQSTKITKDYRPSVQDYSHVADPLFFGPTFNLKTDVLKINNYNLNPTASFLISMHKM